MGRTTLFQIFPVYLPPDSRGKMLHLQYLDTFIFIYITNYQYPSLSIPLYEPSGQV